MRSRQVRYSQNHMATTFVFTVSCTEGDVTKADTVLKEAHALTAFLEDQLSEFRPQSKVSLFNGAPAGEVFKAGPHLFEILKRSIEISNHTADAFDITFRSSQKGDLASRIQLLDGDMVQKRDGDLKIGLGAIGKGYALDRVRALLEKEGFFDYCLTAGGSSILLSGFALESEKKLEPWTFAWSTETEKGISMRHDSGLPIALGMSGILEKGSHIAGGTALVKGTLVASLSALDADAYSTGLFVSESAGGAPWLQENATIRAAATIDSDNQVSWTAGFAKLWRKPVALSRRVVWMLPIFLSLSAWAEEGAIDLDSMSSNKFNPYLVERSWHWVIPAVFMVLLTVMHLRKLVPGIEQKRRVMRVARSNFQVTKGEKK